MWDAILVAHIALMLQLHLLHFQHALPARKRPHAVARRTHDPTGPIVLDIVQHFTERWNEIRKRKYREPKYPVLALRHNVEAVVMHPHRRRHRETWRKMGHHYRQRWLGWPEDEDERHYAKCQTPGMRVEVVRSVSDWSHGVLTEHSIPSQNAYRQLIREAEHFIYIENQF
ncbi:hypothetical protein FB45DRAFT_332911 [Roridomyces roridus]|uniref:Secreted protein n=1 Tax=Roridomyces roridus TaxID=1738132 RepID=A0AAD7B5L9_9AGAR|nr:hypothetical protein FB45DRAFT_332911 [Roridomyces roridus]